MSTELHEQAKRLFLAACEQPVERRSQFIAQHCAGNRALRDEVQSLLDYADDGAGVGEPSPTLGGVIAPPQIDGYRIVNKLGEGGMGDAWEAEQLRPLRRRVALKILKQALDTQDALARFDAERQALARMDHPWIATIFDAGATTRGRPYFAMEFVDGVSITDYCNANQLQLRQRLALFAKVCRGVQHAHDRGIIHRDLKPANLLVTSIDDEAHPKIIDFGIAKWLAESPVEHLPATQVGSWLGTPEYMSPEQTEPTAHLDGRSDVYTLGVVLYELLADARPFEPTGTDGSGIRELLSQIRHTEPSRPSTKLSDHPDTLAQAAHNRSTNPTALLRLLRGDLDSIVLRALEKHPDARYDSPLELAADIQRYLDGEPVTAARARGWRHVQRRLRQYRHPIAAWGVALMVLGAAISLFMLWPGRLASPTAVTELGAASQPIAPSVSVAVLPFKNLGSDAEDIYLSEGLSDEVSKLLARVDGLQVAARTSAFSFKDTTLDAPEIAQRLGVSHLLLGTLRRSGQRLTVESRLIEAASGRILWSQSYDRGSEELLTLRREIAGAVVAELELDDSRQAAGTGALARPTQIETYDLYLRGRHLTYARDPVDLRTALALFERAIELDPTYAPAYTGLADTFLFLSRYGDIKMDEARAKSKAALERALQLDNQLPDAHASLGLFHLDRRDPEGAEVALRRAIALNPNHALAHLWLGHALVNSDRPQDADPIYERAVQLDPLNPQCHDARAATHFRRGNYDQAIQLWRRKLVIGSGTAETYRLMALAARTYGKLDAAVEWSLEAVRHGADGALNYNELAMAYGQLGFTDRGLVAIEDAQRLAPNNDWVHVARTGLYHTGGRRDEFERYVRQMVETEPISDSPTLHQGERVRLVLSAYVEIGDRQFERAAMLLERAVGRPPSPILEMAFDIPALVALADVYRRLDRADEMQTMLAVSERAIEGLRDWIWPRLIVPDSVAAIQLLRGDPDTALETLVQAAADGWLGYWGLVHDPLWDDLRSAPEFQRLLVQMKTDIEHMRTRLTQRHPELQHETSPF